MCSVNDEYDDAPELMPEEKAPVLDDAICQKCKVARALVVLRGKDVYCNECFLASATHKFRATLGKSKIVRPKDKILVAHSGKSGSTSLLHLIRAGMHESVHKRLVFETTVLYVDDTVATGQSLERRKERIQAIQRQTSSLDFECHALSLSQSVSGKDSKIQSLQSLLDGANDFASSNETLRKILNELRDDSSRRELTKRLREKLYVAAARKLGCNKIFLADDSTSLAVDILSNVTLGRGAQLSYDVGFLDDRHSDVTILRPMRDFTRHELSTYVKIKNLEICESIDETKELTTIQSITGKFVTDLDSRFTGTVSTIFRTGEKISSGGKKNCDESDNCALCEAPLDTLTSDSEISAIQATAFSRFVSNQESMENFSSTNFNEMSITPEDETIESKCCGKCSESCSNGENSVVSRRDLTKFLCYGCRLIFRNSDVNNVPHYVLDNVRQRLSLESMREEIEEFLL